MAATPAVSVVLAARNEAGRIGHAIQSILDQTLENWELVVIDDGSTDETAAAVGAFADARIQAVRMQASGLAAALNRGIALAGAPLVARQDADDLSFPTRLERQLQFMGAHPDVAVLGCPWIELDRGGEPVAPRVPFVAGPLNDVLPRFNPLTHSSVIFRRDVVLRHGGYDDRLSFSQDYDLWLRLARADQILWNLDGEPLVVRTMTGTNVSARQEAAQIRAELRIRWRDMRERRRRAMPALPHLRPLLRRTVTLAVPVRLKRTIRRRRGQAE
jgi:glycosyltransferase involved in cell wall biosynthesis